MSKPPAPINPKGIFDRSTLGMTLAPVTITVERGRMQFFAKVLGEADPIHSDAPSARARGFPDIVAPASFFTVIDAEAGEERKRLGQPSLAELVKFDFRYLLHGDETYEYLNPIFAGEEVVVTTAIVDFYDKKGGNLEFVTFASKVEHAERGLLLRASRNLLHRLA